MLESEIRPSPWYYALAALVFIAGWVFFALFLFKNLSGLSEGLRQVVVPGKAELTLLKPGKYTIYHEYRSVVGSKIYAADQNLSGLECVLVSKTTGAKIPLSRASASSSYSVGGRAGVSVFDFTVDRPGVYELSAAYSEGTQGPEVVLAVGQGFVLGIVTAVFGGLAIVFGAMAAAVAIALVTLIKRSKAKKLWKSGNAPYAPLE